MEKSSKVVSSSSSSETKAMKFGNPFSVKVGQVFTGFGIGCGVGIGVGRPINLAAVPMVNQIMGATRGATDAFSGVSRHVTDALNKVGAKNIEAGIGCGVGFGHGFGVGLALKPGVLQQIQLCAMQTMKTLMTKVGISPDLPILNGAIPSSFQSSLGVVNDSSSQNPVGNIMQMTTKPPDFATQGLSGYVNRGTVSTYDDFTSSSSPVDAPFGSRTEKVLSSFLQSPMLKGEDSTLSEVAGRLKSENRILHMVLKHQQIIDELTKENEKLRHILVEDLKVPTSKLEASYTSKIRSSCSDCFECRRKQRRR